MPESRQSVTVRISLFALLAVLLSPLGALFVLMIAAPAFALVVANGFGALAVIMAIAGIMLARRLFSPHWRPPPGSSDSGGGDGGGGGGSGPREPSAPPGAPRGGLPLPDSDQSRERMRDHDRPKRRRLRPRRPAREPDRAPVRGSLPARILSIHCGGRAMSSARLPMGQNASPPSPSTWRVSQSFRNAPRGSRRSSSARKSPSRS